MVNDKQLIPGAFYWVIPEVDPDAEDRDLYEPGQEWHDEIQPARFNGWNANGEMLWNFLGFDGSSDWSVPWVGEAIEVPVAPPQRAMLVEADDGRNYSRSSPTY